MLSNNPLLDLLLLQSMTKSSGTSSITDPIDQILTWAKDYEKKKKEERDKANKNSPDRKIFSVKDLTFVLLGFAVPGGLLMIQGWAYLWNLAYDSVHMMH